MEFDQQKLQKLIQHNLIYTAIIIFFSYITLFLFKITFLFFFKFQGNKKIYIYISIDDRNVSREPLMHTRISSKSLKFAIYNRHGDFYQKRGSNLYIKVNVMNGSWIILLTCRNVILRVGFLCQYDQNNDHFLYWLLWKDRETDIFIEVTCMFTISVLIVGYLEYSSWGKTYIWSCIFQLL